MVRGAGIACFILSALAMAKIHSMYPEKHDSPIYRLGRGIAMLGEPHHDILEEQRGHA